MSKEIVPIQEIIKREPHGAFLVFTVAMMDEHGEVLGHLMSTQKIPPRHGRGFEGSKILINRRYRQTGPNEITASFNILL